MRARRPDIPLGLVGQALIHPGIILRDTWVAVSGRTFKGIPIVHNDLLGVLGGMGPLATADFMQKVIAATPATRDQDHLPMIIHSIPQIPDRSAAILSGAESPLPALLRGLRTLESAGASAIAIPCNTAHHWADELATATALPILHIADAVLGQLHARCTRGATIGLMATQGTRHAGFFQRQISASGFICVLNTADEQAALVTAGIYAVKQGDLNEGARMLEAAVQHLIERGATAVVLACTEIPLALDHLQSALLPRCVDSTAALAADCVAWWREIRHSETSPCPNES